MYMSETCKSNWPDDQREQAGFSIGVKKRS